LIGYYLTHPQVAVDPAIPVPQWSLSERGRERVVSILDKPWLQSIRRVVASSERKAIETAELIAARLGLPFETHHELDEDDRSATGFIPPEKFDAAADAFFGEPEKSWRDWERAIDAQQRIVGAVAKILSAHDQTQPILFTGHGGVGTLLKCHLEGLQISRQKDQPGGGGNIYAFSLGDRKLLSGWTALEQFEGI
jgi:broad specificity phosphatase PhoE